MPDFLTAAFGNAPTISPSAVAMRLVAALVMGAAVAWIYRRTRTATEIMPSFSVTIVLLSVLIAMVTQVIGDSVARAFSLVGALSIVRFRTVVRDTQDTAYVIFAVVIGMAVGASDLWVAAIGLVITGIAAWLMRPATSGAPPAMDELPFLLNVRVGLGQDANAVLGPTLDAHTAGRRLITVSTAKQGLAIEVAYALQIKPSSGAEALVRALNTIDGVQDVDLSRRDVNEVGT